MASLGQRYFQTLRMNLTVHAWRND